jgi:hypothetical protein
MGLALNQGTGVRGGWLVAPRAGPAGWPNSRFERSRSRRTDAGAAGARGVFAYLPLACVVVEITTDI